MEFHPFFSKKNKNFKGIKKTVALGMVLCLSTLSLMVVLAVVLYHYTSKWLTNLIRVRLPVGYIFFRPGPPVSSPHGEKVETPKSDDV